MSWRYREPLRCDFDTDEEYEEAYGYYEDAESDYIAEYEERCRG